MRTLSPNHSSTNDLKASGRILALADKYGGSEALRGIIAEVGPVGGSLLEQNLGYESPCRHACSHTTNQEMLRLQSPCETRIEAECLWPRDANFPEIRMARIEKEIRLPRHQHTRHAKHRGVSR